MHILVNMLLGIILSENSYSSFCYIMVLLIYHDVIIGSRNFETALSLFTEIFFSIGKKIIINKKCTKLANTNQQMTRPNNTSYYLP